MVRIIKERRWTREFCWTGESIDGRGRRGQVIIEMGISWKRWRSLCFMGFRFIVGRGDVWRTWELR